MFLFPQLPPDFMRLHLGPRLKYSSCYWPEGVTTLGEAELKMFQLYGERAQIKDGIMLMITD